MEEEFPEDWRKMGGEMGGCGGKEGIETA